MKYPCKHFFKIISFYTIIIFITSCVSTPDSKKIDSTENNSGQVAENASDSTAPISSSDNSIQQEQVPESQLETEPAEITEASISDNNSIDSTEQVQESEIQIVTEVPEPEIYISPVQQYKELAAMYTFTVIETPPPVINGRSFKKSYKICVLKSDTNEPAQNISVTALYPAKKTGDNFQYAEILLTTDTDGVIELSCPVTSFTANTFVTFYITPNIDGLTQDEQTEISQIISGKSLKLPYQVKTNMQTAGGSIAILDYDKKGKLITNNTVSSSALLTSLMKLGFSRIGNSDFPDQIDSGKTEELYKKASELFGRDVSYLIYGTVKYDGAVIKSDDGYTINLIADVSCYDMQNKKILAHLVLPISSTEKTEWDSLNNARVKLFGPQLAEMLLYGM